MSYKKMQLVPGFMFITQLTARLMLSKVDNTVTWLVYDVENLKYSIVEGTTKWFTNFYYPESYITAFSPQIEPQ
jgi:hypothetical protein